LASSIWQLKNKFRHMKLRTTFLFILIPILIYAREKNESTSKKWDKGYCNFTSYGYLIGSGEDEKTFVPSLHMENNYRFNKNFAFGLYTGIDWLDFIVAPIGPNLKILFPDRHNKTSFFVGGAIGGSIALQDKKLKNYDVTDTRGGRFANIEIGVTLYDQSKLGVFVAGGYRHQQISYTRNDWRLNQIDKTITYNRFVFRIGVRI